MTTNQIKFIYFGNTKKSNHRGILTVAYRYNSEKKLIEYALSFCSPKDRFSKKIGRKISSGRLKSDYCYRIFDIEPSPGYNEPQYRVCLEKIRQNIIDQYDELSVLTNKSPSWFDLWKVFPGIYLDRAK